MHDKNVSVKYQHRRSATEIKSSTKYNALETQEVRTNDFKRYDFDFTMTINTLTCESKKTGICHTGRKHSDFQRNNNFSRNNKYYIVWSRLYRATETAPKSLNAEGKIHFNQQLSLPSSLVLETGSERKCIQNNVRLYQPKKTQVVLKQTKIKTESSQTSPQKDGMPDSLSLKFINCT